MALKEDLIAAGLDESQAALAEQVLKSHIAGEFVPKHRFDEVNNKAKELSKELIRVEGERDAAEKERKQAQESVTPLQEQLEAVKKEWEDKYTQLQQQHEQEEQDRLVYEEYRSKLGSIKNAIGDTAYDPDMVSSLIDLDSLTIDGDSVTGVQEALESVKKSRPYLFKTEQPLSSTAPTSAHSQTQTTNFGEMLAKKAAQVDALTQAATEKYFGKN